MNLNIKIDKNIPKLSTDMVSFETGATKEQLKNSTSFGYEHHGEDFTEEDVGALPQLYEDLILGKPLPTTIGTPKINGVDTIVALTLFSKRDLLLLPSTVGWVYSVDLAHRRGLPAMSHLDPDLTKFIIALQGYFPTSMVENRELGNRLKSAIEWVSDYLRNGNIPVIDQATVPIVRIKEQGIQGFVSASVDPPVPLLDGWMELYRVGFLQGIVFENSEKTFNPVLITKKSKYLPTDLVKLQFTLNQLEKSKGNPTHWDLSSDALRLYSNTSLPVQTLVDIMKGRITAPSVRS